MNNLNSLKLLALSTMLFFVGCVGPGYNSDGTKTGGNNSQGTTTASPPSGAGTGTGGTATENSGTGNATSGAGTGTGGTQ